jgi:hypothetical protein
MMIQASRHPELHPGLVVAAINGTPVSDPAPPPRNTGRVYGLQTALYARGGSSELATVPDPRSGV